MTRNVIILKALNTLDLCKTEAEKMQLLDEIFQAGIESTFKEEKRFRAVKNGEVIGQYNDIAIASKELKIPKCTIQRSLRLYRETKNGVRFKYNL